MASSERSERQAAASEPRRDVSPLERAKQIAASMARSAKDARWLGMRTGGTPLTIGKGVEIDHGPRPSLRSGRATQSVTFAPADAG